ncbi:uncharacterized protein LOC117645413 isoform X1 [Thrips palmi]|uniref:Uncharacterized protein LOC117645413 isoform X1 n=1 Tax=Thrips palmi TaxID=161013 RepID=A0A6P8ZN01_THRPL|nr:uncharacterized protein LOC117645413 isoform X1 [Thrips palmi]
MHLGVALLAATALVVACHGVNAAGDGETSGLLSKLHRVARSPQVMSPQEMAERAREAANMARDAAKQHVAERGRNAQRDGNMLGPLGDVLNGIAETVGGIIGVDIPPIGGGDADTEPMDTVSSNPSPPTTAAPAAARASRTVSSG